MSSSKAKSQAEQTRKSKTPAVQPPTPPPPPQDTAETDTSTAQWLEATVQDVDEGDEIVGEILNELMGNAMDICYQIYLKTQHVPFTASWAKSHSIYNVVRHFISLDVGEGPNDLSGTEDFEPVPTRIDAWGQGCVPVVYGDLGTHKASVQKSDVSQSPVRTEPTVKQKSQTVTKSTKLAIEEKSPMTRVKEKLRKASCFSSQTQAKAALQETQQATLPPKSVQKSALPSRAPRPPPTRVKAAQKKTEKPTSPSESLQKRLLPLRAPRPPPTLAKAVHKKTEQATVHTKSVQKSALPSLPCSTEKNATEVESKAMADPDKPKTELHQGRREIPMSKIDPSSLPKHCSLTKYEIVDDEHKKQPPQDSSVRPKLSTKYTKRATSLKQPDQSGDKSKMLHRKSEKPVGLENTFPSARRAGQVDGPLRRDTIVLLKGVSLLESPIENPDPYCLNSSHQVTKMKPLQSDLAPPRVPIADINVPDSPFHIPPQRPPDNSSS